LDHAAAARSNKKRVSLKERIIQMNKSKQKKSDEIVVLVPETKEHKKKL
jgi:hypothetical protein